MTWTDAELTILKEHAGQSNATTHAALAAAGYHRTRHAVRCKRSFRGWGPSVDRDVTPLPTPLGTLPRFTARVAAALHALAESAGLTLAEYDKRKAEILGGEA